jgi:hypothetical protein
MKAWKTLVAMIAMIAMLGVAGSASAQPYDCCSGAGNAGQFYNSATETTVAGTVEDVRTVSPPAGGRGALHLTLNTSSGPVEVHVGPTWYVSSRNITFAKGDAVTLIGSKMSMSGREVLVAREITKGQQTLTLRAANGAPVWSGHHHHHHGRP